MLKKYIAKETKSFTVGQSVADIVKGNKYEGDRKLEYFIGEFGNTIYLPMEQFETYFNIDKRVSLKKAVAKYYKNNVKVVYLRLFPEDKDIIDHLANIKEPTRLKAGRNGQSEYIRKLIREDMEKQR